MCIIAVKPKGVKMIEEKNIRTMFRKNEHGAGYMIHREGAETIALKKGFATVEDLLTAIESEDIQDSDVFIVHFRIATSGKINDKMCHPFVIHKSHKIVNAVNVNTSLTCFAHNGIISKLNGIHKEFSDTSIFSMAYLSEKPIVDNIYESEAIQDLIETYAGPSRLVFLHPKKGTLMLGSWEKEKGIHYSNGGYKDYSTVYNRTSYAGNGKSWSRNGTDDHDEDNSEYMSWSKDVASSEPGYVWINGAKVYDPEYYKELTDPESRTYTPINQNTPKNEVDKQAQAIDKLAEQYKGQTLAGNQQGATVGDSYPIFPLKKDEGQGLFTCAFCKRTHNGEPCTDCELSED